MASIAEALDLALTHHRAGTWEAAETLYRRILEVDPAQADALNLLARLCLDTGRGDEARDLATRAVAGSGGGEGAPLPYLLTLAEAAALTGQPTLAVATLRAALAQAPERADLWQHLGRLLAAGQDTAAQSPAAFERAHALSPRDGAILNDWAVALQRLGREEEALARLEQAVALEPQDGGEQNARALANLCAVLLAQAAHALTQGGEESVAQAERLARRVLALTPTAAAAWSLLGQALAAAQRLDEAAQAFATALAHGADPVDTGVAAGDCLTRLGRFDEAERVLLAGLERAPDHGGLLNNTAILRHQQGRLEQAQALFERAIERAPDDHRPEVNLGTLLKDMGQADAADAHLRRALALAPDLPAAHWQYALARLAAGDLATGWREYEWRWRTGKLRRDPGLAGLPDWTGAANAPGPAPLQGLRLVLEAEQGHGDTLQFIRYAGVVRALGATIGVAAQPALRRLLTASLPGIAVWSLGDAPVGGTAAWDAKIPLMSLPLRLAPWLGADAVPAAVPYLHPAPADVAAWGARLAGLAAGPRVGLVWAGDPRRDDPESALIDRRRSLDPAALAALRPVTGLHWISLQKGAAASVRPPLDLLDWTADLQDFADTAALVSQCDLVLTVDTAVAHLAGGLGRPVWLLSRYDGCWRWQQGRDDSPWYPHMRLFRQKRWGDWSDTLADVAQALAMWRPA